MKITLLTTEVDQAILKASKENMLIVGAFT